MIHENFKKVFNKYSMICFFIKWKQNKQVKWWWCMKIVKASMPWLFWKIEIFWNWCSVICFFTKRKQSKQVKLMIREDFKEVFKWFSICFFIKNEQNRFYFWFLFFDDESLFHVFWFIRLFKTRMKVMIYKKYVFQKFLIYQAPQNAS